MIAFIFHMKFFCVLQSKPKVYFSPFWGEREGKGERIIASGNGPSGTYHNRSILKKQKRNGTLRSYHGAQYHCPLLHCLVHLCFVYKGKSLAAESTIPIDCDFSYYCCECGIYFSIFFPPALRILIKKV